MKTYQIKEVAGYRGAGQAFATVINGVVMKLTYIDDLIDAEKDCDMGSENLDLLPSAYKKISDYAKQHPTEIKGMCSCTEFCVQ
jgi:hypothetical protein